MFKFYGQEYGVTVEVRSDTPDKVRVHADRAVFFHGATSELSAVLALATPININPVLLQFMQWYDERESHVGAI